ncbi:MAG: hypothetical protein AAB250_15180 [Bdellovibrionota bacterium]
MLDGSMPFFARMASSADLAVGYRIYNVSLHPYVMLRHFLSLGYKALVATMLQVKVRDSEVGYKFFSRRFADHVVAESRFDDWFWDSEVCLLAQANGLKTEEITGAFVRNPLKTSTVHVLRDSIRYLKALSEYRKLLTQGAYQKMRQSDVVAIGRTSVR